MANTYYVIHDTLYVIRSKNTYYVCFDMFYVWCRITDGILRVCGRAVNVLIRSVTVAGLRPDLPSSRDSVDRHCVLSRETGSLGLSKGVPSLHGDGLPGSLPTGGARSMAAV